MYPFLDFSALNSVAQFFLSLIAHPLTSWYDLFFCHFVSIGFWRHAYLRGFSFASPWLVASFPLQCLTTLFPLSIYLVIPFSSRLLTDSSCVWNKVVFCSVCCSVLSFPLDFLIYFVKIFLIHLLIMQHLHLLIVLKLCLSPLKHIFDLVQALLLNFCYYTNHSFASHRLTCILGSSSLFPLFFDIDTGNQIFSHCFSIAFAPACCQWSLFRNSSRRTAGKTTLSFNSRHPSDSWRPFHNSAQYWPFSLFVALCRSKLLICSVF